MAGRTIDRGLSARGEEAKQEELNGEDDCDHDGADTGPLADGAEHDDNHDSRAATSQAADGTGFGGGDGAANDRDAGVGDMETEPLVTDAEAFRLAVEREVVARDRLLEAETALRAAEESYQQAQRTRCDLAGRLLGTAGGALYPVSRGAWPKDVLVVTETNGLEVMVAGQLGSEHGST